MIFYPIGIYPTKYEWAGLSEKGDCSLKILDANLEYDDGVWQCQVTPSSFQSKDSLISEGAELVVRGKKEKIPSLQLRFDQVTCVSSRNQIFPRILVSKPRGTKRQSGITSLLVVQFLF